MPLDATGQIWTKKIPKALISLGILDSSGSRWIMYWAGVNTIYVGIAHNIRGVGAMSEKMPPKMPPDSERYVVPVVSLGASRFNPTCNPSVRWSERRMLEGRADKLAKFVAG